MAKIVLGVGTSHSALLALGPEDWLTRAKDDLENKELNLSDGRYVTYEQLLEEVGPRYVDGATLENLTAQALSANAALDRLADEFEAAAPDVVIIIGDDHEEMYSRTRMPAVAIFYGEDIVMHPWGETWKNAPAWFDTAMRAYAMDAPHRFDGSPEIALALIDSLMDLGVDVSGAAKVEDPAKNGLGHAFGFVISRLFRGKKIPVVPLLVNTYYTPNVVRPARCHDIGRLLRKAIEALPGSTRVAIVGSGGLSHFVTDETLDRKVLAALSTNDAETLRTLPMAALHAGSSEILCWVMTGGAVEGLDHAWSEYVPVYRTPAGTGVGLAFSAWRPGQSS